MIIYHNVIQGSPEWKLKRKGLWTGSTATRLLQGKPLMPESDWDGFKDAAIRGHMLEHAIVREYNRKYRRKMKRPGFITNTIYPNAGYSPDGTDGPWLIEMKSFYIDAENIPLEILVQVYFGMIITGKRKARLITIDPDAIGKEQLTVIEIFYDKEIGNNIRRKLRLDQKRRLAAAT